MCAYRYDQHGQLGGILKEARQLEHMTNELADGLRFMVENVLEEARSTFLCSTRERAATASRGALSLIKKPLFSFNAIDFRGNVLHADAQPRNWVRCTEHRNRPVRAAEDWDAYIDESGQLRSLFNTLAVDPVLELKVGSRVIFTQNNKNLNVSNGTIGEVINFRCVALSEADKQFSARELPYGVTTAMAEQFWHMINAGRRWPVVKYMDNDGNRQYREVVPSVFTKEDQLDKVIVARMQVPLLLAHGMTIHRAQGNTLDSVIMSCDRIFAHGQFYTGITRGRGEACTQLVQGLKAGMKLASKVVIAFDRDTHWHVIDNGPSKTV